MNASAPASLYALYAVVVVVCAIAAYAGWAQRAVLGRYTGLYLLLAMGVCVAWALWLGRPGLAVLLALLTAAVVAAAFAVYTRVVTAIGLVHAITGSTVPPSNRPPPFWRALTGL